MQGVVYAMARNGKTFANHSIGRASFRPEDKRLCQPDSMRMIASITKIFTASAILKLVEDGMMLLTDAVSKFVKEFNDPIHGDINLRHLLTHTSGLASDDSIGDWFFQCNWIESLLAMPIIDKPGSKKAYSSMGFVVLGEVVERVTGMTIEEVVTQMFFEPLGMTDSHYDVPLEKRDRVIVVTQDEENVDDFFGVPRGAWGIYTTTSDLLKFGQIFLDEGLSNGKHILSRKTVERLRNDVCLESDGKSGKYGLGFGICTDEELTVSPYVFGHGGSGWAGASELLIDPTERFVWAQFAAFESWVPEALDHSKNIVWSGLL